jgi:hypothetical protein
MSLLNQDLETLNAGSGYKFSATKFDKLGATEYTLASVVTDASGSVDAFAAELTKTLKTILKACAKSPRKENLMLRLTQFANRVTEIHGFKLLGSIKDADYDNILNIGGSTALFDAMDEAIQATAAYGDQLTKKDFLVNAIIVVVTDGEDNVSHIQDPTRIKATLESIRKAESLESIRLILVGVTQDNVSLNSYLTTVKGSCGVDQYVSIGSATPGKLAKLAEFVSQSISSTSAALGTGAASTPLNPPQFTF